MLVNEQFKVLGSTLDMHKCSKPQSNLQLLSPEKITKVDELTTKLALVFIL